MTIRVQTSGSPSQEKPNVFVLHCGLDINSVNKACEKLDLEVNIIPFRREEVFAYYVRLNKPGPDMIVIRSHFRPLIQSMNLQRSVPTLVVSTHHEPANCHYPYIQANQGYEGPSSSKLYEQMALAILQELS